MDDRPDPDHARDRSVVLAAMPSVSSWTRAVTTAEVLEAVQLPEPTVLHLLHELDAEGLAGEVGGRWRRRGDLPAMPGHPAG